MKRSVTLLEVLIALSLTAIVLGAIFTSYRNITTTHLKAEKAKAEVLNNKNVYQRLNYIFSRFSFEKKETKEKNNPKVSPPFYTTSLSDSLGLVLNIEYDNGIDPESSFCNQVRSELYLNRQKELCLATYSKKGIKRMEVLKENVQGLNFQFFNPSSKDSYSTSWSIEKEGLPAIVEMTLVLNKDLPPIEFAFFVSNNPPEIIYKRKGAM